MRTIRWKERSSIGNGPGGDMSYRAPDGMGRAL